MSELNPFAALLQGNQEIEEPPKVETNKKSKENSINALLERIFAFTLNEDVANEKGYMYIGNEQSCLGKTELDFESLSYCLFERVFSCSKDNPLILSTNPKGLNVHSKEDEVIVYLYSCYEVYKEEMSKLTNIDDYKIIKDEIIKNAATAFIYPDIYMEQRLHQQLIDILLEERLYSQDFSKDIFHGIVDHEEAVAETLRTIFKVFTSILETKVTESSISNFDMRIFLVLKALTTADKFAVTFMECMEIDPQKPPCGLSYVKTLLGSLINVTILPKELLSPYEHFADSLSQAAIENTEGMLWGKMSMITENLHSFILSLLKSGPETKEKILVWIGKCLEMNSDREKLSNYQTSALFPATYKTASDGFMVHLGNILLRLCRPLCMNNKMLQVDPTYCAVPDDLLKDKQMHLAKMSNETCLLPTDQDDPRLVADSFNFTTECFYLAHRAIHLGFSIAVDKAVRTNHELGRIERAYNEVQQQASSSEVMDTLKDKLTSEMSKFLAYRAQLSEPTMLSFMFEFLSSSCHWLCQVAIHTASDDMKSYAPLYELPVAFPLKLETPKTLQCIPEFIVENVFGFVVFLMRFCPKEFETQGHEKMGPILTFIVMFMGNYGLIKNPHLRAQLAEALDALLPVHEEGQQGKKDPVNYQRTRLFAEYEYKKEVVTSLLEVFVGIEMTGQSVEFEQKFNYRRPMYGVMGYLWKQEEYQRFFRTLAEEAEQQMEAVQPPIFLRFINLLINDAIFLLDEALSNMAKLKEMQAARDNGDWDKLPARERSQNLSYLHHAGMMARFDNILGRDTINTLERLTSKITIVFTHSTMVDRMAAMLNYFLLNLVGPNKKNFKVKDQKEYRFEPAETVLKICKIYINLKNSESFCLAISQDGRSYSPNLFTYAEDVLIRIGGSDLILEMRELAERVAKKAAEYQVREEAASEAPEHYLDPIMSTLMLDPVILPSSKQVVDRTTIARHLLSDQTDPFNRSPLSMDQVISNDELANEIREWLEERRKR